MQLIVTIPNDTVSPMANTREHEEFSKRLRFALRQAAVTFDSPTSLSEEFSARYPDMPVTQQAVRKWLNGEAIPTQARVQALALWLAVGPEWLRFGKDTPATHSAQQPFVPYRTAYSDNDLVMRYRGLTLLHQQVVSEIISSLDKKRRKRK